MEDLKVKRMSSRADRLRAADNASGKEVHKPDTDSESHSGGSNGYQTGNLNEHNDSQPEEKVLRKSKAMFLQNGEMKFMNNFDPESSNREKRKLNRKLNLEGGGKKNSSLYDENGCLRGSGKDNCDCLVSECPGCHFPCPKCRSCKCGPECRVYRKWMYESIEKEADWNGIKKSIQTL